VARIGGDEFTIILTNLAGPDEASAAAERVLEAFRTSFRIEGHEVSVGASIGISRSPLDGNGASALLQSADAAMYCAKRSGNNRYQLFTAQMRQEAYQRLVMEMCLRNALEHREISLVYQPQYELATGKLAGFEALCRWTIRRWGLCRPTGSSPCGRDRHDRRK
jgi:predicted signal transduction protein with EAL and GGDEF domain